jgi:uracil-DNA glycosylase
MVDRDEVLAELGLTPVWRLRARSDGDASSLVEAEPRGAPSELPPTPIDTEARDARIATLEWRDFAADVDACTACGLCRSRRKSVPGVGDARAEWLFVGEAPGSEEDARGEPFVGQAGKLLDNMLAALAMKRGANVYIANVLKCRPPNNRTPEPREVESCRPYLDRQIALIKPKIIVALGRSAATTLLNMDASIASLRGRVHRYQGVPLVVTYHPAYLLRNLPDKAKAWEDLLFARRTLRSENPPADPPHAGSLPL